VVELRGMRGLHGTYLKCDVIAGPIHD
jgi:hypothetical protein